VSGLLHHAQCERALLRLQQTGRASREDLARLLAADGENERRLLATADRVRSAAVGDEVHLRALIEFSNHCRRNCLYCGLRRGRAGLARYRMTPQEIAEAAEEAAGAGFGTVVLQSGEDLAYTAEALAAAIRAVKARCDVAVTLSLGERTEADYARLRDAGADRFLLRIETSNPDLYERLHPDSDWHARLGCLHTLRSLGYQVGSGVMIGLPGQSLEMLADDLLFLRDLQLDMIGVGPFIPHPTTPLGGEAGGRVGLSLRFLALLRLLCPRALIPATTALGTLSADGLWQGLQAGADVLMLNVTPLRYRERYDLYPGKAAVSGGGVAGRSAVQIALSEQGRRIAAGHGHSRRRGSASVCSGGRSVGFG
jgi:biotin synthase